MTDLSEIGEIILVHQLSFDKQQEERLKSYLQNFYTQTLAPMGQLKLPGQLEKPNVLKFKLQLDKGFNQVLCCEDQLSASFQNTILGIDDNPASEDSLNKKASPK